MHRFCLLILAAVLLVVGLMPASGAAAEQPAVAADPYAPIQPVFFTPPRMDLSNFRFRCFMFSGRNRRQSMRQEISGACGFSATSDICDVFQDGLEALHDQPGLPTRPMCLATCREQRGEVGRHGVFGCQHAVRDAWRTCTRYCRSNFP